MHNVIKRRIFTPADHRYIEKKVSIVMSYIVNYSLCKKCRDIDLPVLMETILYKYRLDCV